MECFVCFGTKNVLRVCKCNMGVHVECLRKVVSRVPSHEALSEVEDDRDLACPTRRVSLEAIESQLRRIARVHRSGSDGLSSSPCRGTYSTTGWLC